MNEYTEPMQRKATKCGFTVTGSVFNCQQICPLTFSNEVEAVVIGCDMFFHVKIPPFRCRHHNFEFNYYNQLGSGFRIHTKCV